MLFNSLQFIWFFPLTTLLYFALPHRIRWAWLLAASYWFYMSWRPQYGLLLAASTALAYGTGMMMESASPSRRKAWLLAGISGNLAMLFFFKYFNFAAATARSVSTRLGVDWPFPDPGILLPVGVSFFVFQSLGYILDVHAGRIHAERHVGRFALFLAFFPQLVAGPIERAENLLPQLRLRASLLQEDAVTGLRLMLWGMFQKVVIADRLALIVNPVYDNPTAHSGGALLTATYFFAFQIFCDFSGYSLIAMGSAKVLGIDLMANFRSPYFSASVAEFWKRWHISLSTWFRDYLYLPLGGNRVGRARWCMNILIVFMISGLWHGANWTFVVWGALHGAYLLAGSMTRPLRSRFVAAMGLDGFPRMLRAAAILFTFHIVLFAWIFFRARSMTDAWFIVSKIAGGGGFGSITADLGQSVSTLALSVALIILMEVVHFFQSRRAGVLLPAGPSMALRWAAYLALLLAILNLRPAHPAPFIYFQF